VAKHQWRTEGGGGASRPERHSQEGGTWADEKEKQKENKRF